MDPRVDYVDEIEPMTDTQLGRVRGVDGVDWAVPFFKGLTVAHTRDGMLQQVILLGVDDATLTGVTPRLALGSVENLKQPDAMIIDRAGFQFMCPGEAPGLGKAVVDPNILTFGPPEICQPPPKGQKVSASKRIFLLPRG